MEQPINSISGTPLVLHTLAVSLRTLVLIQMIPLAILTICSSTSAKLLQQKIIDSSSTYSLKHCSLVKNILPWTIPAALPVPDAKGTS